MLERIAMKNIRLALLLCSPFCFTAAIADEDIDRAAVVNMVQAFFDAMSDRDARGANHRAILGSAGAAS